MKTNLILIFMALTCALNTLAQEHAKFMGIPINGTITQFQQKLQAKGIQYDQKGSQSLDVGQRLFKGVFAGENAHIYVGYIPNTKIVYYVGVAVLCFDIDDAKVRFNKFKRNLDEKYDFIEEKEDGTYSYFIKSNNDSDIIGDIQLWYKSTEYDYSYPYTLYLKYTDWNNYVKHDKNVYDDF